MQRFDLLVIGAGPGGYVAAIRAAQLGLKVACVDSRIGKDGSPALGGTCLNVGCIPSKALLDSSERFVMARDGFADHGIGFQDLKMDVPAMLARKDRVVRKLTGGVEGLFRKNGVTFLPGLATLQGDGVVALADRQGQSELVEAEAILLATGSSPVEIPVAPVNGKQVVDSTGALEFTTVPKRLGIIGAGVIGLELGSVWRRLGSEVTILEALPDFLPAVDRDVSAAAMKVLSSEGIDIKLDTRVTGTRVTQRTVKVICRQGEGEKELVFDRLIVAVGRRPFTGGLGLEVAGVKTDAQSCIEIDANFATTAKGVYAIGDVVRGPMLAHKASEEGVAVAERIAGQSGHVNYGVIPGVIYTWPELAWVGEPEQALQASGTAYRAGVFPFVASGRAHAMGETRGMVKILAEDTTDRILGVHILGPNASELIAEAVVAMEYSASAEDLARTIHAHPTLSEAVHEAALAVGRRALHV